MSGEDWSGATLIRAPSAPERSPGAAEWEELPASLAPGHTLAGRYTVLDRLGQGGMGVVLAAYDARLDRRVALKLLRTRSGSSGSVGEELRLVREAQAMARLNHPHVVAVYDSGSLEDGSLFIAMEYVEGRTLRQWGGERARSWREVLEVYLAAGRGLAAAHAAGLIHRDFKPDNVLVGQDGRIRVTDFGLARARHAPEASEQAPLPPEASAHPVLTGSWSSGALTLPHTLMGTPGYMALELFEGRPADERSDLFAFCASLYEALYGELPFKGDSLGELARVLREGRVEAPASSEVPAWVARTVLRGLAAEPRQRPASMEELLAALGDDPEVKRKARLRTGALALVVVGLAGLAAWGWVGQRAPGCGHIPRQLAGVWDGPVRARVSEAMLGTGLPYAQDSFSRVASVLDGYAGDWVKQRTEVCEAVRQRTSSSEVLVARRESCLARRRSQLRALTELLSRGPDRELLPRAVQAARSLPPLEDCANEQSLLAAVPPPEDPVVRARVEASQEQVDRLDALHDAGKYKEGLTRAEEVLREVEQVGHGPLHARTLHVVGRLRDGAGDYPGAEALARRAIEMGSRSRDPVLVARSWTLLYFLVGYRQARHQDAALLELGLESAVELANDDDLRATAFNNEGIVLSVLGKYEEAREKYGSALALREKALGSEHLLMTQPLNNLGNVLEELGRYEEARRMHERALAIREKALGPRHPDLATSLGNLGNVLTSQGRYEEARQQQERALAVREEALGPEHPLVATSLDNLGSALTALGRYEEAKAVFERELALLEKTRGPEHPRTALALHNLGNVLEELGRYGEARAKQERALVLMEKALGPEHPDVADPLEGLGRLLEAEGRYAEARVKHERALALREKALGPEHLLVARALNALGQVLTAQGRYEEAREKHEQALALQEKLLGREHPELAASLLGWGRVLLARGKPAEAVPLLERALKLGGEQGRARVRLALARALWESGREHPRALELAAQAREHWRRLGHPSQSEVPGWLSADASP